MPPKRKPTRLAVLASVGDTSLGKVRLCDIQKLENSLKLRTLMDWMVFQTNASGILQEGYWYI
jgi:hypothetical protein